ncbi:MAG: signal peptidase II [bacterium]
MHIRRLVSIVTSIILLDQATKALVMKQMSEGESIPIIDDLLSLTFVFNPGAAFGFLSSASEEFRIPFFFLISLVAMAVVLFIYFKGARENLLLQIGLSMVLGGAAGNLIDRILFKKVIDFIDVYYKHFHWPAFNVADSAITIGVFILIVDMVLTGRREKSEAG